MSEPTTPSPAPEPDKKPGNPEDRVKGLGGAVLRFFGSLIFARYPEDRRAQKRATIGAIALAVIGILGARMRDDSKRTDALIKAQREDFQSSITATLKHTEAVNALVAEMKLTRTELLQKIPDAKTTPINATHTPAKAKAKRAIREPAKGDWGGVKHE